MLIPRKKKINQNFKIKVASIPAPVGGLNARDSIAAMPESDAVILDNWFPTPTNIVTRNGSTLHNSNPVAWVEALMAYNGASSSKLFAADSGGEIRDVTNSGTGAVADVTGLTNGRFQHINMSTAGGHFLLAVNGSDKLQGYDGSAWWEDGDGTHDITGVDTADIININIFKRRVWLTKRESTKAYYLGVNSIAGAATEFDIGSLLRLGGYLMGIVTWTINDSAGTQEYLVFVSSEGECLVYQGYDPNYESTFALAAQFRIGRPVGRRFYNKVGSDIVMITADGAIALSKALLSDRSAPQVALSNKITNSITSDVSLYGDNFGWQVLLYPIGNKLFINVPKSENSIQYQYVMNTITQSWCSYGKVSSNSAWLASCFEIMGDSIYYGGNGAVYQCDIGSDDNGTNIVCTAKPAFSYFKQRGLQKLFTMIKPYFQSEARVSAFIGINLDFEDKDPTSSVPITPGGTSSLWNVSVWNVAMWSSAAGITKAWQSVTGTGVAATIKIIISSQQQVSLQAVDYVYQPGGIL